MADIRLVNFQKEIPDLHNAAKALRKLADDIEAGDYPDYTTVAMAVAHTSMTPIEDGAFEERSYVEVFACGPKHDVFTTMGVFHAAAAKIAP